MPCVFLCGHFLFDVYSMCKQDLWWHVHAHSFYCIFSWCVLCVNNWLMVAASCFYHNNTCYCIFNWHVFYAYHGLMLAASCIFVTIVMTAYLVDVYCVYTRVMQAVWHIFCMTSWNETEYLLHKCFIQFSLHWTYDTG